VRKKKKKRKNAAWIQRKFPLNPNGTKEREEQKKSTKHRERLEKEEEEAGCSLTNT